MSSNNKSYKIFDNKLFRIIFSIVLSISLWIYIEYAENPDHTQTINNIPVDIVGMDELEDSGLTLTSLSRNTVSIRFTGKRSDIARLYESDLSVTVDLNTVIRTTSKSTGIYQLSYTINYPDGVNESKLTAVDTVSSYVSVNIEKLVSENVVVMGNYDNLLVAEGYIADPTQFDTDVIVVTGPESVVSEISHAVVDIQRENVTNTISEDMDFIILNDDGKEVSKELLSFSQDRIHVTVPISMVKDVALTINFIEGKSASLDNAVVDIRNAEGEPLTAIELAGSAEILEDINAITLGTIDLTSFSRTFTEEYPIVVPEGIDNLSGETTAYVTVTIADRDVSWVSVDNIQIKNEPENCDVQIVTQSVDITLRGTDADLNKVDESKLSVIADLSELGNNPGTYSVPAKVNTGAYSGVDAVGTYKVTVKIS